MGNKKGCLERQPSSTGCGGGTRTTRPPGYEPGKLPTAPLRDINRCTKIRNKWCS